MFVIGRRARVVLIVLLLATVVWLYLKISTLSSGGRLRSAVPRDGRILDGNFDQQDPELIAYARNNLLLAPDYHSPYRLGKDVTKDSDTSQWGQQEVIRKIFDEVIGPGGAGRGFFVEAGALDGVHMSNTLWFERNWNWTGLLVEPDVKMYAKMVTKGRKAWLANTCLSPKRQSGSLPFYEAHEPWLSGLYSLAGDGGEGGVKKVSNMHCVPLYTLLAAVNQTVVDFFSLDVEGAELDVLRTIPFNKVHIKVLAVETVWIPGGQEVERTRKFMHQQGYRLYTTVHADSIFVHSQYLSDNFAS